MTLKAATPVVVVLSLIAGTAGAQTAPAPGGGADLPTLSGAPGALRVATPRGTWHAAQPAGLAAQLRARFPAARVEVDRKYGTLEFLRGDALSDALTATPAGVRAWLASNRELLALADPSVELSLLGWEPPNATSQWHYFRFQQIHRGLRVVDGELTVLLDPERRVHQITGHYPASFACDLNAELSGPDAIQRALDLSGYAGTRHIEQPRARLVIFIAGTRPRLAWEVMLGFNRPDQLPVIANFYLDADTGLLLGRRSRIYTQTAAVCNGDDWSGSNRSLGCTEFASQGKFLLRDRSTLSDGAEIRTQNAQNLMSDYEVVDTVPISSSTSTFVNVVGVNAHYAITTAYEYYQDQHGRPSWNHGGAVSDLGQLNQVNYGVDYANAAAYVAEVEGKTVSISFFGNGDDWEMSELTACLDVAGHELTHNVIVSTANLAYENESGALNEHFADAFGTAMDKLYEDNDDLLGENCMLGAAAMRSMSSPTDYAQPDHLSSFQVLPNTEDGDWGGVHVNSGIPNRAFYNYYSSTSVSEAEQVWYRTLNQGGLVAQSQFNDFVNALDTACAAIGTADCAALDSALADVGLYGNVGTGGSCPANSTDVGGECICDTGYQPNVDGTACEVVVDAGCPANSTQYGEYCYCDDGYDVNAAGTGCVPADEAPCPANAHRVGDTCYCDDGYYGNPNVPDGSCELIEGGCTALEYYDGSFCQCIPGFEWVTDACYPIDGDCGDETFIGRCIGDLLVFCDDETVPASPINVVYDCPAGGWVCGWDDANAWYDCLDYVDPCGSITVEGQCDGNTLSFCLGEGDERAVYTFNCTDYALECTYDDFNLYYDCLETSGSGGSGGSGGDGGDGGDGGTGGGGGTVSCNCSSGDPTATLALLLIGALGLLGRARLRRRD